MAKKVKKAQAESQVEVQETVTVDAEETKPAAKPKVDRRPYILYVTSHLELGDMDRKSMLKEILEQFPSVSRGGTQTFLCDMLNPKYTHYKDRVVVKLPDGKVIFQDKLPVEPAATETLPVEAEPNEQPAE